ncbi:uncharacterized protein LOC116210475 [Punica granatum]|uniref:Uncharacterized protein n=2 Tax=Punica granatum TaxID=22663 RepID=A0A2I0GCB8_PUNGR|nr:uncharacterized protein LOC116210475 [Punica granatum]PKH47890.1 hypothetical protein CRG98_050408 [Punica granatum]
MLPTHGQSQYDSSGSSTAACDELSEDDIFWMDDLILSNLSHTNDRSSPRSLSTTPLHIQRKTLLIILSESFGILGVLREHRARSNFDHKRVLEESAASSSRTIPKESNEQSNPTAGRYHQSMPVTVPVLTAAMIKRHHHWELDDDDDDDEADDSRTMVPPHEMVAKSLAQSQMAAFSVLEGARRTLKGRDLRQVRNAVFRQTSFLD